jgi:hypothetical protein
MNTDRVEVGLVSPPPAREGALGPISPPPGGPAPDDVQPFEDDSLDTVPQDTPLFDDDLPSP